jgi:o-succinylbenzoate synthase
MSWQADFFSRTFDFRFEARTSRGRMTQKKSWFLRLWDDREPERIGVGECSLLLGLSPENPENIESQLVALTDALRAMPAEAALLPFGELRNFAEQWLAIGNSPALLFAFETALLDWQQGGNRHLFANSFVQGQPIPINGLIWMGGLDAMLQQIEIKIRDGFTTIKMKVGGLDFEKECDILQYVRRKYFRDQITLRLDANGAFKKGDARYKLNQLARFEIHSIEQPVPVGSPEWKDLCKQSPIPIALDEELIGVAGRHHKEQLLDRIQPQYIILKPSLHGGLSGCAEWIDVAKARGIDFWMTSALESNIGLNAIAQFTAGYAPHLPQGLGTGSLYHNNWPSPLEVAAGQIRYNAAQPWGEITDQPSASDTAAESDQ